MSELGILSLLGRSIFERRKALDLSQDEVCDLAGFSRGTISKIENGRVDPQFTSLCKISKALGVPITELLDIDGIRPAAISGWPDEPFVCNCKRKSDIKVSNDDA